VLPRADRVDLVAGLLVVLLGASFLVGAFGFEIGTLRRMGPGFLPLALSIIAVALGLLTMLGALGRERPLPKVSWRPMLAVLASIGTFALLLEHLGLMPTLFATVVVASFGDPDLRPLPTLILALLVCLGCWLIFLVGIDLPIPAFRSPL
jgi:Tripartite tricarboxylate transporter TctB family